jgi:hypothetical protein
MLERGARFCAALRSFNLFPPYIDFRRSSRMHAVYSNAICRNAGGYTQHSIRLIRAGIGRKDGHAIGITHLRRREADRFGARRERAAGRMPPTFHDQVKKV